MWVVVCVGGVGWVVWGGWRVEGGEWRVERGKGGGENML